jgi:hypothetical protein
VSDGGLLPHFQAARHRVAKWAHFLPIYEELLGPYRGRAMTLVEVGVGDGGSLEAWRSYLGPAARIIGVDVNPSVKQFESNGFEIIIGDQSDPDFWARHLGAIGPIDVLIDDGGHTSVQQIVTVACAVPHISDGGAIVVEDTHASYMPDEFPAPARYGFMPFAQHVVDVMHVRNPYVTQPASDTAGLGAAIHRVAFHESIVVFHVDRRLCGPSALIEAGVEELAAPPSGIRSLIRSARGILKGAARLGEAGRVKRYFR